MSSLQLSMVSARSVSAGESAGPLAPLLCLRLFPSDCFYDFSLFHSFSTIWFDVP